MSEKSITIYHLYPDLLNLYGDKGNIASLSMRCKKRGINAQIKTLTVGQEPDFSDADIVLFGGGADREMILISSFYDKLAEPFRAYVENGGVTLALCDGYPMMGNFCEINGEKIKGFGILDIDTTSGKDRLIGNIVAQSELDGENAVLAGFENHIGRTNIKSHTPLGKVRFGYGNDGEGKEEGVVYKNTIATYLYGPLLPKNPELADWLIKKALEKKYGECTLFELDDTMEMEAKKFVVERGAV